MRTTSPSRYGLPITRSNAVSWDLPLLQGTPFPFADTGKGLVVLSIGAGQFLARHIGHDELHDLLIPIARTRTARQRNLRFTAGLIGPVK